MIRPGLLGFVGIPLSRSVEVFLFGGTPRFGGEAIDCGSLRVGSLAHDAWSCRPAVEAGLRGGWGSTGGGTSRGGWGLLGFYLR